MPKPIINETDAQTEIDGTHVLIDWVTIYDNETSTPLNDGHIINIDEDGQIIYTSAKRKPVQGSHDSRATVRVTDKEREITFNPSRKDRLDNVFGYTWPEALDAINRIWADLGQPPMQPTIWRSEKLKQGYTGPRLTRLDATVNIATGSPEEAERLLRAFAQKKVDQRPTRHKDGTVYWGQSAQRTITKAYDKAKEIREHAKKRKNATAKDLAELERLAAWCEENGIVRLESKWGRGKLRENNWREMQMSHDDIVKQLNADLSPILNELDADQIAKLSRTELGTLAIWLRGYDVRKDISQATFYRHRQAIKRHTGYDIATEILCLEPKKKPFKLTYPGPPDWYALPPHSQRYGTAK